MNLGETLDGLIQRIAPGIDMNNLGKSEDYRVIKDACTTMDHVSAEVEEMIQRMHGEEAQ